MLQNPDVLHEVENPHFSSDGVMRDVMDGDFFNSHPIFSTKKGALQIFANYDDLELANPLGSKSKIHKIGKNNNTFFHSLYNRNTTSSNKF